MKRNKFLYSLVAILPFALSSCATGVHHSVQEYVTKELDYVDNFTILQLTDTHIGDKDNLDKQFGFITSVVNEAKSRGQLDMIVVTGDLFTFAGPTTMKKYFALMDSFDKPWTVTFGNHDEQTYFSIDYMTGYLNELSASNDSKCVFKDIQDDDVMGNCNHVINLTKDGKVFEQLIMMDSNRYHFGSYNGYDYFHQDQIDWYKSVVKAAKNDNAESKSIMFYHIPLPEIDDAFEKGEVLQGEKREKTCPPKENSGFFKVIKEEGHTNAMFFGHDHINDFVAKYENIIFSYGIKTDDRIYYDEDMIGGQTIKIKNDHSVEINHILMTYKEGR